jgi:hypothetical protein
MHMQHIDFKDQIWGWQAPDSDKYFCSQSCKFSWLSLTWKTLNMVDRLSLSDTDERAKVMPRLRMMSLGGVQTYYIQRVDNRTEID